MGKGTIISGGAAGEYQLQINYNTKLFAKAIDALNEKIAEYEIEYAAIPESQNLTQDAIKLKIISCQKRIDYLNENTPEDSTITAWCVDLTEDLTGEVGTIEIPGEVGEISIQPGFEGNASYDKERDGQLLPPVPMTPSQFYYNMAILPAWQKWLPTYRYGTIKSIDSITSTANVELVDAISSQQDLNINQGVVLSNVPFEYMGEQQGQYTFFPGDDVVVKFIGQNFYDPIIIGFKNTPFGSGFLLDFSLAIHVPPGTPPTYNPEIPSYFMQALPEYIPNLYMQSDGGIPDVDFAYYYNDVWINVEFQAVLTGGADKPARLDLTWLYRIGDPTRFSTSYTLSIRPGAEQRLYQTDGIIGYTWKIPGEWFSLSTHPIRPPFKLSSLYTKVQSGRYQINPTLYRYHAEDINQATLYRVGSSASKIEGFIEIPWAGGLYYGVPPPYAVVTLT